MWTYFKSNRLRASAVTVGVVAVIGVIWFFSSLAETLNHIMPGPSISASMSMEPYELDFATGIHNNVVLPKDTPPFKWTLKVPRAFLVDLNGKSGVPNRGPESRNFYAADLHAVILPDNSGLSPATLAPNKKPLDRFIAINIYNESADWHMRGFDACVTDDDYKKVMEAHGAKNEHDRQCFPQENRCDIYSHLDGWYVQMTVTRDIYADPENVCRLVKAFLNEHTVHRDDLR